MYFLVKGLRRQIEIPPDKFGKHIDVLFPQNSYRSPHAFIFICSKF